MKMRVSAGAGLTLKPEHLSFDSRSGARRNQPRTPERRIGSSSCIREGFAGLFVTHSAAEAVYLSSEFS